MMTDKERKLFDQIVTLTTELAAADTEAKMYRDWYTRGCELREKLEKEIVQLKAELAALRETGTIVVHDKPIHSAEVRTELEARAEQARAKIAPPSNDTEAQR